MTYVPSPPIIREGERTEEEQARYNLALNRWLQNMVFAAYRISFRDIDGGVGNDKKAHNVDGVWVSYTSNATADTEDTVPHKLDRTPVGIFVGIPDKSAVIYDSGTAWTSTNIYLKASAATVQVNIFVF